MQGCFAALSMTGTVTVKPSTRSARSIAVTSVLKLWRHRGRREPPIWLRPTAALGPPNLSSFNMGERREHLRELCVETFLTAGDTEAPLTRAEIFAPQEEGDGLCCKSANSSSSQ